MISFASYKVKFKDTPYTTEEGVTFPGTIAISFLDEFKKEIYYLEKAYIDTQKIYELMDEGKAINLNECYVENFSLSSYRTSRNLDKKQHIPYHYFSATNAIFDSNTSNDFSYSVFEGDNINFENALFINGKTDFHSSVFGDNGINFSNATFKNGNVDFSNIKVSGGNVIFKNALFGEGTKNFQYAYFGHGEVSFINTEFGMGDILFINTDFGNGDVSFKISRLGDGKKDFHYSKFGKGDISFERTEFGNGKVDFRVVEFNEGKVNFSRSVFGNGEVNFEACHVKSGKLNFKRAEFGNGDKIFELIESKNAELILERSLFGSGNVSFRNSEFDTLSLKSCHLDNYFDLRLKKCGYVDLSDTIVRDIIDFIPYDFNVDINILNISGMRLLGSIYIDWERNNLKKIIDNQPQTNKNDKAEQFRILKVNFNKTGQYSNEDKSYVEFKRYEQKSELETALKKNKLNAICAYPSYWFKLLVFDKIGLYATSPVRVLLSMIIIYLFFSIVYIVSFYISSSDIIASSRYTEMGLAARSFYHSAITFLTIGYGDHYPVGPARVISSIEGFTGLFLMSYFTVAFVHKVLR